MSGRPSRSSTSGPSSACEMHWLRGTARPMSSMTRLKRSRSSAFWMASILAPINSTP